MRHRDKKTCQVHAAEMPREEWFGLVLANHVTVLGSRQREEGKQSFFLLGNSWGKLITWIVGSNCKTTASKTDLSLVSNSLYFTFCHLDLLFATLVQRYSYILCCSAFTSRHITLKSSFLAATACALVLLRFRESSELWAWCCSSSAHITGERGPCCAVGDSELTALLMKRTDLTCLHISHLSWCILI